MLLRSLLLGSALLASVAASAQSDLERVNQIRRYCDDINATHWTDRRVAELDESWIDAYYRDGELRKISVRTFDEAGSGLEEYYLRDTALIHVYTQSTRYDRSPADSTTLEAALQPLSTTVLTPQRVETRAFFVDDQLIRHYTSAAPLTRAEHRSESERLSTRFLLLRKAVQKD